MLPCRRVRKSRASSDWAGADRLRRTAHSRGEPRWSARLPARRSGPTGRPSRSPRNSRAHCPKPERIELALARWQWRAAHLPPCWLATHYSYFQDLSAIHLYRSVIDAQGAWESSSARTAGSIARARPSISAAPRKTLAMRNLMGGKKAQHFEKKSAGRCACIETRRATVTVPLQGRSPQ